MTHIRVLRCAAPAALAAQRGARLALAAWCSAAILAGQHVTVPSTVTNSDTPGIGELAGANVAVRQQFLIDDSHLGQLRGKTVSELWFRRDIRYAHLLEPGLADLTVTISTGARAAADAVPGFAANHGPSPAIAFQGRLTIPRSPAIAAGYNPWDPQNTVRIVLVQPFLYGTGNLCIEIRGTPVAGSVSEFWPIDFLQDGSGGWVGKSGTNCNRASPPFSATARAQSLRVASTAEFIGLGRANTAGIMLLDSQQIAGGLSLDLLGAPGCRLYVSPVISISRLYQPWPQKSGPGFTNVQMYIPNDPGFMGATLFVQWANPEFSLPRSEWTNPAGLTTSNLVQATLSSLPNTLGMCTVTSALILGQQSPATGEVDPGRGPVIRFIHL